MPIDTDRWDVTGTVTQTGGRAQFVVLGSNTSEIDNKFNDAPANPNISSATWRFAIVTYNVTLTATTGVNTTEFGLYTTAGNFFLERTSSKTELVVFTSSENYRDTVAASYGKTLEIERDAFTFSDLGGSTGYSSQESVTFEDVFFDARYAPIYGTNPPDNEDITSGAFTMDVKRGDVQRQAAFYILDNADFDEDFSYSVNIDVSGVGGASAGTRFGAGHGILVTINGTTFILAWYIEANPSLNRGICYYDGSSYTLAPGYGNTTGGSWKLDIRRVGSTVSFYIDDVKIAGADQVKAGSVTDLMYYVNNNTSLGTTLWTAKFTNSILTVGSEYTEDWVFFNEDTDTRYIYDNGAVDVSAVSIKLTSDEALSDDTELIEDFDFESPKGTRYGTEM